MPGWRSWPSGFGGGHGRSPSTLCSYMALPAKSAAKSSTSSATPAPEPVSQSRLTSTVGIIHPAPHPIQSRSPVSPSNDIRLCQPGTRPLLRCESTVASTLSTYNTAAEFKDVRVEAAGRLLYRSNFTNDAAGWVPQRGRGAAGTWSVEDGAYRQKDRAVAWSYFGDDPWKDITITVKARKISGDEGFIASVGSADGPQVQLRGRLGQSPACHSGGRRHRGRSRSRQH